MKVCELPVNPKPNCVLRCMRCEENYSCAKGDYFLLDPADEMDCPRCGDLLQLVGVHTSYRHLTTEAAEVLVNKLDSGCYSADGDPEGYGSPNEK